MIRLFAFIVLLCIIAIGNAQAQSRAIASLLFPDSAGWQSVNDMPHLKQVQIDEQLAETLWSNISTNELNDSSGCMASMRLFFSDDANSYFHEINLGNVNNMGLFYSGPASCNEGAMTITWPDMVTFSKQNAVYYPAAAMLIEKSVNPRFIGFQPGCCGSIVDTYLTGFLLNYGIKQEWFVEEDLVLPKGMASAKRIEKFSKELVLRSAPLVNDRYRADRSDMMAAFGNVERRYLPGVTATVIAEWRDQASKKWILVTVDQANNGLCTCSFSGVNIGWVADN